MASQAEEAATSSEPALNDAPPSLPPLDIKAAAIVDARPAITRASTEPASPSSPSLSLAKLSLHPARQRNRSPYARHPRSKSTQSTSSAPLMTRAHSSPTIDSSNAFLPSSPLGRPSSPHYSSVRRASPLRHPLEESSFSGFDIDQTIAEHDELDIKPRPSPAFDSELGSVPLTPTSPYSHSGTFPRTRRTPASPLANLLPSSLSLQPNPKSRATLKMSSSSPTLRSSTSPAASPKYNEAYPMSLPAYAPSFSTVSSMPSTPTSFRSRSPSISSLETIPDSPDAEEAAIEEAERDKDAISKLKAAIEREGTRRGSFEGARGRGMFKDFGYSQEKRKRWSVCGAERRGDLGLEVIWED